MTTYLLRTYGAPWITHSPSILIFTVSIFRPRHSIHLMLRIADADEDVFLVRSLFNFSSKKADCCEMHSVVGCA